MPAPPDVHDDLFFDAAVRRYVDAPRFVRRDWLVAEVEEALAVPTCRLVLLTGEPGVGKSGALAQIATDRPDRPRYLLRRDQRSPLADGSARSFLLRVGFQLAALHPELLSPEQVRLEVDQRVGDLRAGGSAVAAEVDRILSSPFHQSVVEIRQQVETVGGTAVGLRVGEWIADPRLLELGDLAAMALLDPARVLARLRPDERLVVLVDALDELGGEGLGADESLVSWLMSTALPANVRVVVTSRPGGAATLLQDRHGEALRTIAIDAGDQRVRADLAVYLGELLGGAHVATALREAGCDVDDLLATALDRADGNVGYLDALGRAVDRGGPAALLLIDELPADLAGLHAFFLRGLRMRAGTRMLLIEDPRTGAFVSVEMWAAVLRPLLVTLCVAREPLTLDQLAGLSGTPVGHAEVADALRVLSQFLDRIGDSHRFYHVTFADFMTAPATRENPDTAELHVDPVAAHRGLALRLRGDGDIWGEGVGPVDGARRAYARTHLLAHLEAARLWDVMFATLDDPAYARGSVAADPSTFGLCADLDRGRVAAARPETAAEAVGLLPRLWRYGLLRHTLSGHADVYPDDAYVTLALTGRPGQAARLAQLLGSPVRRADLLGDMAEAVAAGGDGGRAGELVSLAVTAAAQVVDPQERAAVAAGVAVRAAAAAALGMVPPAAALDALERLGDTAPSVVEAVRILAAVARLRGRADIERMRERIGAVLGARPDDPSRDAGLAEIVDLEIALGDLDTAWEVRWEIRQDAWAMVRAATALALADPASAAEVSPTLDGVEEAAGALENRETAAVMDARLAAARLACGDRAAADACAARAVAVVEATKRPDPDTVLSIGQDLRPVPDTTLRDRLVAAADAAAYASAPEVRPGHGYSYDHYGASVLRLLLALDDPDRALELARTFSAAQRGGAVEAVALAHARAGREERALALGGEAARTEAESAARITTGVSGPMAGVGPAERVRCAVVAHLASAGRAERALSLARELRTTPARARGLCAVAAARARSGDADGARALLAEVEKELRLASPTLASFALANSRLRLLTAAGRWDAAAALVAGNPNVASRPLIDALVDAGEFERARQVVGGPGAAREVDRVSAERGRPRRDEGARDGMLEEELAAAWALERPESRATTLLDLVRPLGRRDPARAEALLYDVVEQLNGIGSFRFRPTPWGQVCEELAYQGKEDTAEGIAGELVEHDPFDGAVAFVRVARAAAARGGTLDPRALLEKAAAAARRVEFEPLRADARSRVAADFAGLGLVDRALDDVGEGWEDAAVRRAVARRLAEDGRPLEALPLLPPVTDSAEPHEHLAVLTALLDAGEVDRAADLARSLQEPTYRTIALARVAGRASSPDAAVAREAMASLRDVDGTVDELRAVEETARALVAAGLTGVLLAEIRHAWASAPDGEHLVRRLVAAAPLAAVYPDLAPALVKGDTEDFLRGM